MGFNTLITCGTCRTAKKPFQVGQRFVEVLRDKKPVIVPTDEHYCLDCAEPFFTTPAKRVDTYAKLRLAQARLGISV
jgi:hypothetical protein